MKKVITFSLLGVTLMILLALFFTIQSIDSKNGQKTIYFAPKMLDDIEFWEVMNQGVHAAAKEFGVNIEVIATDSEQNIEGQIQLLEDAIKTKPAAIILSATDYHRIVPIAKKIVDHHIQLVTVDSGLSVDLSSSFIGTNNYEAGIKAAQALIDVIEPGSTIAIINYIIVSTTGADRERGVIDRLEQEGVYNILGPYYSGGSADRSFEIVDELLRTHPEVDAIIGLNEPTTVGAARAVKKHIGNRQVKLVGIDSSMEEIAFLEEGIIQAIIVQKPFMMGYLAVKTALDVIDGKHVDKIIDTGSEVITLDNMYTNENQKLLFPFIE